jgi:hypothetical protein
MKRSLLLAAPLLACAARQIASAPPPHWSATLRASVLLQCQAQFQSEKFCDCMTEKLEAVSPDPNVELTRADLAKGLDACSALRPTTADAKPEGSPPGAANGATLEL